MVNRLSLFCLVFIFSSSTANSEDIREPVEILGSMSVLDFYLSPERPTAHHVSGAAWMRLRNQTSGSLRSIPLRLNDGLSVTTARSGNTDLIVELTHLGRAGGPYDIRALKIMLDQPLKPRGIVEIQIQYRGQIRFSDIQEAAGSEIIISANEYISPLPIHWSADGLEPHGLQKSFYHSLEIYLPHDYQPGTQSMAHYKADGIQEKNGKTAYAFSSREPVSTIHFSILKP